MLVVVERLVCILGVHIRILISSRLSRVSVFEAQASDAFSRHGWFLGLREKLFMKTSDGYTESKRR